MSDRQELERILGGAAPEGRKLAGYTIKRAISRGAAALVFEATQPGSGQRVALKVMRPGLDTKQTRRFKQEFRLTRKAAHPNVVAMVGHGELEETTVPYFAMEFVQGKDLEQLVRERGKPPVVWTVATFCAVGSALAVLHRKSILHRDLKPANIMIEEGTERPVLTDLGIAKQVKDVGGSWDTDRESLIPRTGEGEILGTPAFMAPEQLATGEDESRVGKATDIYGFGATLGYALTGLAPFAADDLLGLFEAIQHDSPLSPREVRTAVPAALDRLVLSCMAKNPESRPWSVDELVSALAELEHTVKQGPTGAWPPPWRPRSVPTSAQSAKAANPEASAGESFPEAFGDFILSERLLADPTGVYYLARQHRMQRVVVLKRPRDAQPATLARFRREAQALANLTHPNVVRVFSAGDSDGVPFVTLEQPPGTSLLKHAQGRQTKPARATRIAERIARALDAAHQTSVVHGDLRGENVYVDGEGEPRILGLPGLRSQEGDIARDLRTDVADVGRLLYLLLVGEPLGEEGLTAETLKAKAPEADAGLRKLLLKALDLDEGLSASALADELELHGKGAPMTRRFKRLFGFD